MKTIVSITFINLLLLFTSAMADCKQTMEQEKRLLASYEPYASIEQALGSEEFNNKIVIRKYDLDGDGVADWIIDTQYQCANIGNCMQRIMQVKQNDKTKCDIKLNLIGEFSGEYDVLSRKTNGYRDIAVYSRGGVSDVFQQDYVFDGTKYLPK